MKSALGIPNFLEEISNLYCRTSNIYRPPITCPTLASISITVFLCDIDKTAHWTLLGIIVSHFSEQPPKVVLYSLKWKALSPFL